MHTRQLILLFVLIMSGAVRAADPPPPANHFDLQQRKSTQWAWQPVRAQTPPAVHDGKWPAGDIDRFILAKLEAQGLHPAAAADKRALIRRAYFDLIGLPPKRQEIDAFLNDASPDAFAKVIDRLLANPHFGERWARHWMDLARYSETYGHEFDYPIANAWQYRDYLIRAFNSDLPYDQFVTEQVAGDLLPSPRLNPADGANESIRGTAFWCFAEQLHAPVDVRQYQADCIDNQIDVFGKTFLGLTINCARCHDHKFDPIAQKDYYSLFGILESSCRQDVMLDPHGTIASLNKQINELRKQGNATLLGGLPKADASTRTVLARRMLQGLQSLPSPGTPGEGQGEGFPQELPGSKDENRAVNPHPSPLPAYREREKDKEKEASHPLYAWAMLSTASPDDFEARREHAITELASEQQRADESHKGSELFKSFADGNYDGWFADGWSFGDGPARPGEWDATRAGGHPAQPGIANSGAICSRLHGVLRSPTFTLTRPELLYHLAGRHCRVRLVIDGYKMDTFSRLLFEGAMFDVETGGKFVWMRQSQDVKRYVGQKAHIEIIDDGDGSIGVDEIRFADEGAPFPLEAPSRIAQKILEDAKVTSPQSLAAAYADVLTETLGRWSHESQDASGSDLLNWAIDHDLVTLDPAARVKLDELKHQIDELSAKVPEPELAVALADGSGSDEHVFGRGNYASLGPVAPRGFLAAIDGTRPPIGSGCGRLELARRMVDPSDPFLSRVMVNRLWHHLFGRGIVASTDNFGVMGSPPSHPELLDYLATQFSRDGWSVKKMIRAMMLSSAYQMSSSASDADAEGTDPDNVLLHRANLRRLEAEAIRDSILSVSGRLDETIGGPSVDVYLTPFMEGRGRPGSGPLDGAGRRSLYLAERRNFLSPMMLAFDQPTPFSTMGRRSVSNVPAQALILMNDPFVLDQAKLWARHTLDLNDSTNRDRVNAMYTAAFGRPATDGEFQRIQQFFDRQGEDLGIAPGHRPSDLRLWTDLAHALFNTKEFIFLN
jgi:hypothetical protein